MKRIVKLILIGTLPLWIGILLNSILTVASMPIVIVSAFFMGAWVYLSYKCTIGWQDLLPQVLWLNLFGFVMLILALFQELILGSYWMNYLGMATQLYFLPGLAFVSVLVGRHMPVITLPAMYTAEMVALFLFSLLGSWLKSKKRG